MAKTPHSQYRGPRFNLWLGTWNLHVTTKTWSSQINKHFFKSKNHQWLKLFKNHCNASKGEIKWSNLCFSRCKFSDIIELQEIKKRSDTCTYICVTEMCVCVLVAQLCPTLCHPMDFKPAARLLCPWNSPGKNTGVGCHSLLQRIHWIPSFKLIHSRHVVLEIHVQQCCHQCFSWSTLGVKF